jgi:hypothetical protein
MPSKTDKPIKNQSEFEQALRDYREQRVHFDKTKAKADGDLKAATEKVKAKYAQAYYGDADETTTKRVLGLLEDRIAAYVADHREAVLGEDKTRVLCGIKLGFRKLPEVWAFDKDKEESIAIQLEDKGYPKVVAKSWSIIKASLKDVPEAVLKKLGITLEVGREKFIVEVE